MRLPRWDIMNRVFLVGLGLITVFAWSDAENLRGLKQLDDGTGSLWTVFGATIQPAILATWFAAIAAIAIVWYLVTHDRSEALALFVVPAILLGFGWEDTLYFVFSPDTLADVGCYADQIPGVRIASDILQEACPTATSLILANILGGFLALKTYGFLQRLRP